MASSSAMTRAASVLLAISLLTIPNAASAADPDPWFGADKALHFGASAALAGGAYGLSAAFTDTRYVRLLAGGGVALAAGAGKELYDLSGHGDPSWRDFTWDVIGTIVGLGLAWGLDLAVDGASDRHPLLAPPPTIAPAMQGFVIRF